MIVGHILRAFVFGCSCGEVVAQVATETTQPTVPQCLGDIVVPGEGPVSLIATQINLPGKPAGPVRNDKGVVKPEMWGRVYFGNRCTEGKYDNDDYVAIKFLGKTLTYTTDVSQAGCGCNAALYLVSMKQNPDASQCNDHYCDANSVCGVRCDELDIQEANRVAFHSALHRFDDGNGISQGLGGWVRDNRYEMTSEEYGPGGRCIDTYSPFQVAVSFPVDEHGRLKSMDIRLSQEGKSCSVGWSMDRYSRDAQFEHLTRSLAEGMTPVISYWKSKDLLWLDGPGIGNGLCQVDDMICGTSASFSEFTITAEVEQCTGSVDVVGQGSFEIIATKTNMPEFPAGPVKNEDGLIMPELWGRAYFASRCTDGTFNNEQYSTFQFLGKVFSYTTDVSGAGCGCNAALYLVSMRQNADASRCGDHYCDANSVCGVRCDEIDVQEANKFAFHSALHRYDDGNGIAQGLGGWVRDNRFAMSTAEYGPGGRCIDTIFPFKVSVSFPVDQAGRLRSMDVQLSQGGKSCNVGWSMDRYDRDGGFEHLTQSLRDGMTVVISYWKAKDMLWLDGPGLGGGPCLVDDMACVNFPYFYDFKVEDIQDEQDSIFYP